MPTPLFDVLPVGGGSLAAPAPAPGSFAPDGATDPISALQTYGAQIQAQQAAEAARRAELNDARYRLDQGAPPLLFEGSEPQSSQYYDPFTPGPHPGEPSPFFESAGPIPAIVAGSLHSAATLPSRAQAALDYYAATGDATPLTAVSLESAFLMVGLRTPFAKPGTLGVTGGRPLPMDEASRMARADAMAFHRDMPLNFSTAPAGERVAAAAIKVNDKDKIFTGLLHADAVDKAEQELGIPEEQMGRIEHGFLTDSGRFIGRPEANDIGARMGQGESRDRFGANHGLAAEDAGMTPGLVTPPTDVRVGATAPGLPGGSGIWGSLQSSPASVRGAQGETLWHRAENPLEWDAQGIADPAIRDVLKNAWDMGHDRVTLKNYVRPGADRPETVIVVRDPSQLRYPNAEFDPAKRDSSDLLASIPWLAGAGLAGFQLVPVDHDPFAAQQGGDVPNP